MSTLQQATIRTRYAPSPTGSMHIGNLRTALFEYLTAKSMNGTFVLRIEDTDQERYVEGATELVYQTMTQTGMKHDEGPDIGGDFGPYIQSQRLAQYRPYAEKLVETGHAYYCFCSKERLQSLRETDANSGYDGHCRELPPEEVNRHLTAGTPYVIRQKMPTTGETFFDDIVYGRITIKNEELDDQILIKADGFPTYNFANVIDDHLMCISHVVRGCEYLTSTPKYKLLYEAFGWAVPTYVHLPLIMGRAEDGTVSKLSKRHGSTSFADLMTEGYLPEAVVNYIALLGWAPKDDRELFSLAELIEHFSLSGISKSPAVFDYAKLEWFNGEYIRKMPEAEFLSHAAPYFRNLTGGRTELYPLMTEILQPRITRFPQIPEKLAFVPELPDYDTELFVHKKSKTTLEGSLAMLRRLRPEMEALTVWSMDGIRDFLTEVALADGVKNALVMWPVRIAVTGTAVTPGGAVEALMLLGKDESLRRIDVAIEKLCRISE